MNFSFFLIEFFVYLDLFGVVFVSVLMFLCMGVLRGMPIMFFVKLPVTNKGMLGAACSARPYKFIGFGDDDARKPYELVGFRGHLEPSALYREIKQKNGGHAPEHPHTERHQYRHENNPK